MNFNRILCVLLGIGFSVNCTLLFPEKNVAERWRSSVQKIERSSGQERRLAEKEYIQNLESFQEESVESKKSLRDLILTETADRFHSYLTQNEWTRAALIAENFEKTIPFLGIGDGTIRETKSGNLYSAREDFAADLIFYTGKSKDNRFMALIQKMVPNPIGDARLAFNLACLHALNGNKQKMLHYMKIALFLGVNVLEFTKDSDFYAFRSDPDFIRMIRDGARPALGLSLIPPI
nr:MULTISPECIES: hypothetical protein [Leptospira]